MDPTRLIETRRQAVLQEAEEGIDSGEPSIACTRRVSAVCLDVFEEGKNHRYVELLDLEPTWSDVEPARREADQEAEAMGVGFTGMQARPSLLWQVFA